MENVKLQLACLLIVICVTIVYVWNTTRKDLPSNRYFDILLGFAPWFIIYDGLSAWTINHIDDVADWLNLAIHGVFFLFTQLTVVAVFLYFLDATIGLPQKRLHKALIFLPFLVSEGFSLATLRNLEYVQGVSTNYSMGASAIACFVSVFFYFSMLLFILIAFKNKIEKKKFKSIIVFIVTSLVTVIAQVIYPEILITALVPTILILGIYMILEDPSYRRLEKHNAEMTAAYATLVESRDDSTGGHVRRTKEYVRIILEEMLKFPKYRATLTKDFVKNMLNAAPLHDIGKISTPDSILQKPARLTTEEFATMKQHAAVGGEIIKNTFKGLNEPEFLDIAYKVARHHHEKWNGKGYPDGLFGKNIPLCSRIMAIADVFDAVSAKRCYRDAMPIDKCFQIIEDGSGIDFDPELARIFLRAESKVYRVYKKTFE